MSGEIDWTEPCKLVREQTSGEATRKGQLAQLVEFATTRDGGLRERYTLVSSELGDLDPEEVVALSERYDYPY